MLWGLNNFRTLLEDDFLGFVKTNEVKCEDVEGCSRREGKKGVKE